MAEVVSNAGPLIALARIERLQLLRDLFQQIAIPPAVRAEILDAQSVRALEKADWIFVQSVQDSLAVAMLRHQLDQGESEAIVLARETSAELLLIDERVGTRRARFLGQETIGTLGVLLLAKKARILPTVQPTLLELRQTGFHMDEDLIRRVLLTAGE